MSLRARLVVGLLVLSGAGLLVVGAVTYAEQRSFLQDRLDQQARAAVPVVGRAIEQSGGGTVTVDPRLGLPAAGGGGAGGGGGGAAGGPADGPPGGTTLPPGVYGQQRNRAGRVTGTVVLSYGQERLPAPKLPASLERGALITVDARGDSGLRYRVFSDGTPGPSGGLTIAAVPTQEVDQTLDRLLLVEAIVIGGVLAVLGALSWILVGLGLRPLSRMEAAAEAIAAGDLSRRVSPATPRTEVGRLGLALNAMLDRLEAAFAERRASEERLRRFLADASHELRTPLTSIRGYAEVFRLGAKRSPADTATAMRRIEEEAARMGVLVEDLLTLARLDELREPVREPVDLAALARDAVHDARAAGPDRSIELSAAGPAAVLGDADQLRQVLANLLGNAAIHTAPGTPVDVAVTATGGTVSLVVRDHGPGLPPGDAAALFERFWRAEGGRARGKGSAGLGLAIVAEIVAAHGGRIAAENAQGGGARFTVTLPVDGAAVLSDLPGSPQGDHSVLPHPGR